MSGEEERGGISRRSLHVDRDEAETWTYLEALVIEDGLARPVLLAPGLISETADLVADDRNLVFGCSARWGVESTLDRSPRMKVPGDE